MRDRLDAGGLDVFPRPDDHLLEFIAMLPDERRPGAGVVPWREWLSRQPRQTG